MARVHHILRNPAYIGKVAWHDQVFEGRHEPILSEDVFRAAQDTRASRTKLPSRSHQTQHLLSGTAECGMCGKRLIAHYGGKEKGGNRYVSYSHRTYGRRGECKPFHKSAVIAEIRKSSESELFSKIAADELKSQIATKSAPLKERRESIVAELSEMKERFNTWADRLDRKMIDEDQFRQQNARLLEKKQELQAELTGIDAELAGCEDAEVSSEAAKEALSQFPKVWDHLEIEEQRGLVRSLVEKLEVRRDKAVLKLVFLPETQMAI